MGRVLPFVALGIAPVAVLAAMLAVGLDSNSLAVDFHYELYTQAEALLRGDNPYPTETFEPLVGGNFVWPPLAVLIAAPFTLVSLATAEIAFALLGVAIFAAALWLVRVRDWRVYGACFLWPEVAGEMRVAHLTPFIAVLVALAWRQRNRSTTLGVAIGLATALKFFAWPLVVWLAARRQWKSALIAAGVAAASVASILPFSEPADYARALTKLARHFDQDSYTVFGLLVQLDVGETVARAVGAVVGLALLFGAWRLRSLALGIAAALALSPIVWLDYFALIAIPLAIARPRLSPVWFVPLATWGAPGTGIGIGDPFEIGRVLLISAIVVGVATYDEQDRLARRSAQPPTPDRETVFV